jgi:hypothetical protein
MDDKDKQVRVLAKKMCEEYGYLCPFLLDEECPKNKNKLCKKWGNSKYKVEITIACWIRWSKIEAEKGE